MRQKTSLLLVTGARRRIKPVHPFMFMFSVCQCAIMFTVSKSLLWSVLGTTPQFHWPSFVLSNAIKHLCSWNTHYICTCESQCIYWLSPWTIQLGEDLPPIVKSVTVCICMYVCVSVYSESSPCLLKEVLQQNVCHVSMWKVRSYPSFTHKPRVTSSVRLFFYYAEPHS